MTSDHATHDNDFEWVVGCAECDAEYLRRWKPTCPRCRPGGCLWCVLADAEDTPTIRAVRAFAESIPDFKDHYAIGPTGSELIHENRVFLFDAEGTCRVSKNGGILRSALDPEVQAQQAIVASTILTQRIGKRRIG